MTDSPAPISTPAPSPTPRTPTGQIIRPEINHRTKVVRVSSRRWSDAAEAEFLEELAATCNVTAAAERAGFSTTAVYNRRMRHAGFARAWGEALEQGYARLEAMLVETATDSLRGAPIGGDRAAPAMSVGEAMNLLKLHRASVRGGAPQDYAHRRRAPDIEALRAGILRKIEAVERAAARKRAQ